MPDHVQHDNQPLYAWKNLLCYWIFIVIVFQQIVFVASFQQELIVVIPQPSFPPWVAIHINVIKDIVDPFSKHKKLVFNNIFLILRHKFYSRYKEWTICAPLRLRCIILKSKLWQFEAKHTWHHFGEKMIGSYPKKRAQKESSWFGERRCKLGSKPRSKSRIQFVSNASKLVPRNLDPVCWSCGTWYNLLGFLLFNWRWSTYLRRLDSPMLKQNFVNTRPTILMSSLDTNPKIQLCLGINDMFNDNTRSSDTKTMSHGVFYFKVLMLNHFCNCVYGIIDFQILEHKLVL